jgi:hypothetical protein
VSKVRLLVVPVAVAWLFVHGSVVAATTVLLVTTGNAASDLVCTCGHGEDHGMCPMHHKPADSARCRIQSTQNDLGVALLSTLGPLTLPAVTVGIVPAMSAPLAKGYDDTLPLDRTAPPDAPPPRS